MVSEVRGAIHGTGQPYADGTEPMEILVSKKNADDLPYSIDNRVPIDLQINGGHYVAGLRATEKNKDIWISPDVKTTNGVPEKLSCVLTNAGFKKNDKVLLEVDGHHIVLKMANSPSFSIYTTDPEQGFAEGAEHYYSRLDTEVSRLRGDSKARKVRLNSAPELPVSFTTTTTIFRRNPDVIAEVLERSNGQCEKCQKAAPFKRASDGSPYLEVHHHIPLAKGGKDTIKNALALCPNCHREAHFGESIN